MEGGGDTVIAYLCSYIRYRTSTAVQYRAITRAQVGKGKEEIKGFPIIRWRGVCLLYYLELYRAFPLSRQDKALGVG